MNIALRPTLFFCIFFVAFHANGHVADISDLPFYFESDSVDVTVDKKGHSVVTRDFTMRINDEEGREKQGIQLIPFNERASQLKILAAQTINGTETRDVDLKKYLDFKQIGDFTHAFDSMKQASISFPAVKVGSKIRLKYRISYSEVPFENFFSYGSGLTGDRIESYHLKVTSALPLNVWTQDPDGLLETRKSEETGKFIVEIRSKGLINQVAAQEESPFFGADRLLMVGVSTLPDWKKYADSSIPLHEKLLSEPLPPAMAKIRDAAAKEKTIVGKLEKVTSLLSDDFRYFGDWRRRNGGYVPRHLAEIDSTRYGDCKDLSLATTAIYRSLGLKANVAWIWRGEAPVAKTFYTIPIDTFFNHAITRVEAEGKTYWIDATNPVSYARGVLSDISGRPAFVLDPVRPGLDFVPEVEANSAVSEVHLHYDFDGLRNVGVDGEMKFTGRVAYGLINRGFYVAPTTLHFEIIHELVPRDKIISYTVGDFPRSRVVSDLSVPVKYTLANVGGRTSAGWAIPLQSETVVTSLLFDTNGRSSDIYLENPGISITHREFSGVKTVGHLKLGCDLTSDWIDLTRKVTVHEKSVDIADRVVVKTKSIPNSRVRSAEFAVFQDRVRDCFDRAAVIVDKL